MQSIGSDFHLAHGCCSAFSLDFTFFRVLLCSQRLPFFPRATAPTPQEYALCSRSGRFVILGGVMPACLSSLSLPALRPLLQPDWPPSPLPHLLRHWWWMGCSHPLRGGFAVSVGHSGLKQDIKICFPFPAFPLFLGTHLTSLFILLFLNSNCPSKSPSASGA